MFLSQHDSNIYTAHKILTLVTVEEICCAGVPLPACQTACVETHLRVWNHISVCRNTILLIFHRYRTYTTSLANSCFAFFVHVQKRYFNILATCAASIRPKCQGREKLVVNTTSEDISLCFKMSIFRKTTL